MSSNNNPPRRRLKRNDAVSAHQDASELKKVQEAAQQQQVTQPSTAQAHRQGNLDAVDLDRHRHQTYAPVNNGGALANNSKRTYTDFRKTHGGSANHYQQPENNERADLDGIHNQKRIRRDDGDGKVASGKSAGGVIVSESESQEEDEPDPYDSLALAQGQEKGGFKYHSKEKEFAELLKQIISLIPTIEGLGISGFMKLPYKDTRFFEHQSELPTRYYPRNPYINSTES